MNLKITNKDIIDFFVLLLITFILSFGGSIKYIAIISLGLGFLLIKKKGIPYRYFIAFIPYGFYIVWGILVALLNWNFSYYTMEMTLFLSISFLSALLCKSSICNKNMRRWIYIQFWSIIFNYVIIQGLQGESQYAFILGAFLIYILDDEYIAKKNKVINSLFILILLIFFTDKRLATVSAIICSIIYYLAKIVLRNRDILKTRRLLLLIWSFTYVVMIYFLVFCKNGGAYKAMVDYGLNVSGREIAWSIFGKFYDVSLLFFGKGIGWVYKELSILKISSFGNLHNDIMMTFIDLGFIGFTIWFFTFYWLSKKAKNGKKQLVIICLFLYTVINYMTDNITIYINYWFPLYIMIFELLSRDSKVNFNSKI